MSKNAMAKNKGMAWEIVDGQNASRTGASRLASALIRRTDAAETNGARVSRSAHEATVSGGTPVATGQHKMRWLSKTGAKSLVTLQATQATGMPHVSPAARKSLAQHPPLGEEKLGPSSDNWPLPRHRYVSHKYPRSQRQPEDRVAPIAHDVRRRKPSRNCVTRVAPDKRGALQSEVLVLPAMCLPELLAR